MPAPAIGVRRWLPNHPIVNRSHPLAQGLWFYAIPSVQPSGTRAGPIEWTSSPYGRAIRSTHHETCAFGVKVPKSGPITDFTFHTVKSQTALNIFPIHVGIPYNATSGSWSDPWWTVAFATTFNTNAPYFFANKGGPGNYVDLAMVTTGYNLLDNAFHSYTGTWGPSGARVWRDGVFWESSATAPNGTAAYTPGTVNDPQCTFLGRSPSAPGEGFTGVQALSIGWLRRLSDSEVAWLHSDPFCMLQG